MTKAPEAGKIYVGDAIEIMREFPDKSFGAIITDPVWWGYRAGLRGEANAEEIFTRAAQGFPRLTDRLVVILGCGTDPRPLHAIPSDLHFVRVVWLRHVPATHRGTILNGADVAYVFGRRSLSVKGTRVLPGECNHSSSGHRDEGDEHPCPRPLKHMRFLVHWFTRPGDLILDPFCGSGTTLIAAEKEGRSGVGIEWDPRWLDSQHDKRAGHSRQCEIFERNVA